MWLRVRARGKARALSERKVVLDEIDITPQEFRAYCDRMKKPDFSIATLDRCAREKALPTNLGRPFAHGSRTDARRVGLPPNVSTPPPMGQPRIRPLIVNPTPSQSSADGLSLAAAEARSRAQSRHPMPGLRQFVAWIPPTNKWARPDIPHRLFSNLNTFIVSRLNVHKNSGGHDVLELPLVAAKHGVSNPGKRSQVVGRKRRLPKPSTSTDRRLRMTLRGVMPRFFFPSATLPPASQ